MRGRPQGVAPPQPCGLALDCSQDRSANEAPECQHRMQLDRVGRNTCLAVVKVQERDACNARFRAEPNGRAGSPHLSLRPKRTTAADSEEEGSFVGIRKCLTAESFKTPWIRQPEASGTTAALGTCSSPAPRPLWGRPKPLRGAVLGANRIMQLIRWSEPQTVGNSLTLRRGRSGNGNPTISCPRRIDDSVASGGRR